MARFELFTDGACSGNPGPGGWGYILRGDGIDGETVGSGGDSATTNNRMELTAVIAALEALKRPTAARVHTDSEYVRRGITEWLAGWKARDWKTADKKPVKNRDLWERLEAATTGHDIEWRWVKGHSGVPGNERVDALANAAIDALLG